MPTPVVVVDYDTAWPRLFTDMAGSLRLLLGDAVCEIDHVGSTAVPDLAAKPIIDIDVTLVCPAHIAAACEKMIAAGYEPRGNRYDDDMWAFMKKTAPASRVYLCPTRNETHRRRLAFRDHLRDDPALCAAYALLKKNLARRFPLDGDAYTAAKKAFIDAAIAADHAR